MDGSVTKEDESYVLILIKVTRLVRLDCGRRS
jgi:hypothetical protein